MAKKRFLHSWDEVSDAEMEAVQKEIRALIRERLGEDCDGDPPANVLFIDRRKYEPMHWFLVPYESKAETAEQKEAVLKVLLLNVKIANENLIRFLDIESYLRSRQEPRR